jgi:hypothetical protein
LKHIGKNDDMVVSAVRCSMKKMMDWKMEEKTAFSSSSSKIDLSYFWDHRTHRHTRKHSNAPTTVSVGHYITIANT